MSEKRTGNEIKKEAGNLYDPVLLKDYGNCKKNNRHVSMFLNAGETIDSGGDLTTTKCKIE